MFGAEGGEVVAAEVEFSRRIADGEHEVHAVLLREPDLIVDFSEVELRRRVVAEPVPAELGGAQRIHSGAGEQLEGAFGLFRHHARQHERLLHAVHSEAVRPFPSGRIGQRTRHQPLFGQFGVGVADLFRRRKRIDHRLELLFFKFVEMQPE